MKRPLFFFAVAYALASAQAPAQSRTVTVQESDANQLATAGVVNALPDGGCTLQVTPSPMLVDGVVVTTSPHAFNGGRCAVAATALQTALRLDVGVGDGGVP